jgi:hypothetical protein
VNAGRFFRVASAALVALMVLIVAAGVTLTVRGRAEMEKSDVAFHKGELRLSVRHAEKAALAYVPGAEHVLAAYDRLEAIARGAESEDNIPLALIAWDALRLVHARTSYPGRPRSEVEDRAMEALKRLRPPEPAP